MTMVAMELRQLRDVSHRTPRQCPVPACRMHSHPDVTAAAAASSSHSSSRLTEACPGLRAGAPSAQLDCHASWHPEPAWQQRGARRHLPPCAATTSVGSSQPGEAPAKTPWEQIALNGILSISNVPYSSYVPAPETFLHRVDARIKQLWLVSIYLVVARSMPWVRVSIAATVAVASIVVLPPRLWKSQFKRLGLLCAALMIMTGLCSDGIPPVLQPREPPPSIDGLLALAGTGYNYVILHVWFITVTHRSINLALTAGALTFCALQSASLCLVTTPGEEMAVALRWWLSPLKLLGVKVQEIALTLLLSLRFMSLVFEELRNLSLGLASRGVDWAAHGRMGSLLLLGRLCMRLFGNLFHRSENIAQAMVARGFQGPEQHQLYMMHINRTSYVWNLLALALLGAFVLATQYYK